MSCHFSRLNESWLKPVKNGTHPSDAIATVDLFVKVDLESSTIFSVPNIPTLCWNKHSLAKTNYVTCNIPIECFSQHRVVKICYSVFVTMAPDIVANQLNINTKCFVYEPALIDFLRYHALNTWFKLKISFDFRLCPLLWKSIVKGYTVTVHRVI